MCLNMGMHMHMNVNMGARMGTDMGVDMNMGMDMGIGAAALSAARWRSGVPALARHLPPRHQAGECAACAGRAVVALVGGSGGWRWWLVVMVGGDKPENVLLVPVAR